MRGGVEGQGENHLRGDTLSFPESCQGSACWSLAPVGESTIISHPGYLPLSYHLPTFSSQQRLAFSRPSTRDLHASERKSSARRAEQTEAEQKTDFTNSDFMLPAKSFPRSSFASASLRLLQADPQYLLFLEVTGKCCWKGGEQCVAELLGTVQHHVCHRAEAILNEKTKTSQTNEIRPM